MKNLKYWIWLKITTPTNINFTPQKYAAVVGLNRSRSPSWQVCTGWDTCPNLLALSLLSSTREKTSGMGSFSQTITVKQSFLILNNVAQMILLQVFINAWSKDAVRMLPNAGLKAKIATWDHPMTNHPFKIISFLLIRMHSFPWKVLALVSIILAICFAEVSLIVDSYG